MYICSLWLSKKNAIVLYITYIIILQDIFQFSSAPNYLAKDLWNNIADKTIGLDPSDDPSVFFFSSDIHFSMYVHSLLAGLLSFS